MRNDMSNDMRKMLRGKIHRATITGADLHYEGSVTIDSDLLRSAGIIENEAVCIWDVNNGERFETYTIEGRRGSGIVCMNGACARLVHVGDVVLIMSFGWMEEAEAKSRKTELVFVDEKNRVVPAPKA